MSETNSRDCSDVFKDNKEKILKLVKDYIKDIEDGKNWIFIKGKFIIELGFIDNIDKCNPLELLRFFLKLIEKKDLKK